MAPPPRFVAAALADRPGVRHGFFGRRGGVSGGLYASLNCGFGSHDDRDAVAENRRRAARALCDGDPAAALRTVHQTHGVNVVAAEDVDPVEPPRADAMVTARPGLALGVLTADCAPVLFADADAGVVAAAHAGWRGALEGVCAATVAAMERLGARRARIRAAIGPAIGERSYEVGAEFRDRFVAADAANTRWFVAGRRTGKHMFNLPGYVAARLAALDLAAVETISRDTCAEADMFFSHRRATLNGEPDYGRGVSAIALA